MVNQFGADSGIGASVPRRRPSSGPLQLSLVGIGKIAMTQHHPTILADPGFSLVATASRHGSIDGIPAFPDIATMIAECPELDAVSICTPPNGRHNLARAAVEAGLHVMLEKPPGATLTEVRDLAERARIQGVTLFTTWHSREAAGVAATQDWLKGRTIHHVQIDWKEDIRKWHPGQNWILEPGGMGVFDPGINALSIATKILPSPLLLQSATLEVPAGRDAPIAATLRFLHDRAQVEVEFDFRRPSSELWDIAIDTDGGQLRLSEGGKILTINGETRVNGQDEEYPRLYRHFADMVAHMTTEVDMSPLRLVADAFLLGRRIETDAFEF